jgi:exodeoxyribonuclease-3
MGYHAYWHAGTRASGGYGGTLFLSLIEPESVIIGTGDSQIDAEGRFMSLFFSDVIVSNLYAPTLSIELKGRHRKTDFWKAAEERHKQSQRRYPNRASIWAGDMNVAPEAKDVEAEGILKRLMALAPRKAAVLKC